MKRIILFLTAIVALTLAPSCTHNNGDIGSWFGIWKVTSIKVDGVADSSYDGNIFWSFQSSVFQMKQVVAGEGIGRDERWGTWSEESGDLLLDFTHSSNAFPGGGIGSYQPLPATYLPANQVSRLKILKYPGSEMELSYTSETGKQITYSLKRW
ncbi:MAG: lipocalin-like domain-containing protein [Muribaculaceae bacterium]|nr:lipocalin-like domain-containing protein [Muribaculaceae bacterium]